MRPRLHVARRALTLGAVIHTTGIQFKPPEKSWRPSVRLHIPTRPDLDPPSLLLGRDGQVQNAHTTSLTL